MNMLRYLSIMMCCCFFLSCKEKKSDSNVSSLENKTPVSNPVTDVSVPDSLKALFDQQYPGVSSVNWKQHGEGSPVDMELAGWDPADSSGYDVRFDVDSTSHWAWYNKSSWVGTAVPVKDSANLPATVRNTLRVRFTDYTIIGSHKIQSKDGIAFQVELGRNSNTRKVYIDSTGRVIREKD